MKIFKKAVLPKGFEASGVASGIKRSGKLDLALFHSLPPAMASCKFTANKIQAAPLWISRLHLKQSARFRAIIANSGNANCFNGRAGLLAAKSMAELAARPLGVKPSAVLVASTGIIGKRMPVAKIKTAMPGLIKGLSSAGIAKAKTAIMTTDTFSKEVSAVFNIGNRKVTLCGVAKGAGMIAPNMATMLAFIFTDASITQKALDSSLTDGVGHTFNCITVDGCMSTNDSVMMLANGAAGNLLIDKGRSERTFRRALHEVCLELAKEIVKDAEGASKFIQIRVLQAKSFEEARKLGLAVANSNLFKTAVYGENPNFGRIVSALGGTGIDLKEEDLKIRVSSLKKREVFVDISVSRGRASATIFTSDLTPEYIKINAEYN
jgi:glutamate N-acetyltransferase / amino-acid N-acetyltransferase